MSDIRIGSPASSGWGREPYGNPLSQMKKLLSSSHPNPKTVNSFRDQMKSDVTIPEPVKESFNQFADKLTDVEHTEDLLEKQKSELEDFRKAALTDLNLHSPGAQW